MSRQRANTGTPVTGFVLAGGQSSRMGRDKALLDWHGQTLLNHMTCLLSTVSEPVRIIGREELPDTVPGRGPLGGILTALLSSETELLIVAAVDLPLLTEDFLRNFRCRLEMSKSPIVACKIGSQYPLCLGIRRTLLPEVERRVHSLDLSLRRLIENCDSEIVTDAPPEIFQNVNTDEDYQRTLGL